MTTTPMTPTPAEVADELTSRVRALGHAAEPSGEATKLGFWIAGQHALIVRALRALGEPDDAAVERAAEAMYQHIWGDNWWPAVGENTRVYWLDLARAALTARAADE